MKYKEHNVFFLNYEDFDLHNFTNFTFSVPNRTALVWIVRDDWEQLRRALAKTMDTGNEDGRETHNKACCESPPPQ